MNSEACYLNMSGKPRLHFAFCNANYTRFHASSSTSTLRFRSLLLVALRLRNVKTQTIRVKVDLVARVLQNLRNIPCVLKLSQINVRPALLDGITDKFSGTGLTLSTDNGGLLLLAGFVDDEGGTLSFLLCNLLGFDGGSEFGGKGEVLQNVSGGG
jgi:hypothetical protein